MASKEELDAELAAIAAAADAEMQKRSLVDGGKGEEMLLPATTAKTAVTEPTGKASVAVSMQDAIALDQAMQKIGYLLDRDKDGAVCIKKDGNKKPSFFLDFGKGELTAAKKECSAKEYEGLLGAAKATQEVKGSKDPMVLYHSNPKELNKMQQAAGKLGLEEGKDYVVTNNYKEFTRLRDNPNARKSVQTKNALNTVDDNIVIRPQQ